MVHLIVPSLDDRKWLATVVEDPIEDGLEIWSMFHHQLGGYGSRSSGRDVTTLESRTKPPKSDSQQWSRGQSNAQLETREVVYRKGLQCTQRGTGSDLAPGKRPIKSLLGTETESRSCARMWFCFTEPLLLVRVTNIITSAFLHDVMHWCSAWCGAHSARKTFSTGNTSQRPVSDILEIESRAPRRFYKLYNFFFTSSSSSASTALWLSQLTQFTLWHIHL